MSTCLRIPSIFIFHRNVLYMPQISSVQIVIDRGHLMIFIADVYYSNIMIAGISTIQDLLRR